jgi:site-specific recombinase XerC
MTTPRAEDDPHLDWHSDARGIMDAFANDMTYRTIAGTQVELLRAAARVDPASIPEATVAACFEEHRRRGAEAGTVEAAHSVEDFVRYLTARAMLRADPAGGYAITSVGRDFLRFVEERDLPDRPL